MYRLFTDIASKNSRFLSPLRIDTSGQPLYQKKDDFY